MYRNRRPKKPVPEEKPVPAKRPATSTVVTSTPLTGKEKETNISDIFHEPTTQTRSSRLQTSQPSTSTGRKRRSEEDVTPSKQGKRKSDPMPSPALSTIDRVTPGKRRLLSQAVSQPGVSTKQKTFTEYLKKAGLRLVNDGPHVLDQDQPTFLKSLHSALKLDSSFPANIDHFLEGFEDYLRHGNLGKALECTKRSDAEGHKPPQECLVRLLLNVECLQPRLWKILFDQISELIVEENRNVQSFELINKLLRQLRSLDQILEGDVNNWDKLLELISLTNMEQTKREIILLIPFVIRDADRERAATKISENIMTQHALIPAYLETLAAIMSHTDDIHKRVINEVTDALAVVGAKYLQVMMKFLISVSEDMGPIIRSFRGTVKLNPKALSKDGNEAVIFANTLKEADDPKKMIETWVSEIRAAEPQELLAVDLVALLVYYSTRITPTKNLIVSAFKDQAGRGAAAETDLGSAFASVQNVMEQDFLESILQILTTLFRSKKHKEWHYACFWFRLLMERIKSRHNSQQVLDTILHLTSDGDPDQVTRAIGILQDAALHDIDNVARHAQRVMSLLLNIDNWELSQVRNLMSLLMSLLYGSSLAATHQDEVIIRIRKLLGISNFNWRSKGIVGAAVAVGHMPLTEAMAHVSFLLELSESFSVEAKGLLYDELADAVTDMANMEVAEWLKEKIMSSWEDTYVVDLDDVQNQGKVCYEMQRAEVPIAIPLIEDTCNGKLQLMCPHLRLGFVLLRQLQGIDSIQALIGAPVILPDLDNFTKMSNEERKATLDSLFYCVNLFRELMNGFTKGPGTMGQILPRVKQVIQLGAEIGRRVASVPNYVPPQAQFGVAVKAPILTKAKPKTKGKGKSGKKSSRRKSSEANKSSSHNSDGDDDDDIESDNANEVDISVFQSFLRPLDTNIAVILDCDLVIDPEAGGKADAEAMSPCLMEYILIDYLGKLKQMFETKVSTFGRPPTQTSTLSVSETAESFEYCCKLVPIMINKLGRLRTYSEELLAENDGVYDAPGMFKPGTAAVKHCHTLLLQCLHTLLSWDGLKSERHKNLRDGLIMKMCSVRGVNASGVSGVNRLKETFPLFAKHGDVVLEVSAAVALVQVLRALVWFRSSARWIEAINQMSSSFLSRHWTDLKGKPEKGAAFTRDIKALFTVYMETLPGDDKLHEVNRIITETEHEAKALDKPDDHLESFVCFTKSNFPVVYGVLFSQLVAAANKASSVADWLLIAKSLVLLSTMMKRFPAKPIMLAYAKCSYQLLRLYVKPGLPMLGRHAKKHPAQFQEVVSTMQSYTRVVQMFVCDAKCSKDNVLVRYAPMLRHCLDQVIMNVKASVMFAPGAFSTGTLKNRNLLGEEVPSQQTEEESDANESAAVDSEASDADEGADDKNNSDDDEEASEMSDTY